MLEFPVPIAALLGSGMVLGALGDALLHVPAPPGLNLSLWIASVAIVALTLQRRAGVASDRQRGAWLAIGVSFAAGLTWRDAPPLRLLALASATLTFALAAHRLSGAWTRRAGIVRYAGALALGALHAWLGATLALATVVKLHRPDAAGDIPRSSRAAAVVRGLVIAAPLIVVFGGLFMSADAVFAKLVTNVFRMDFEEAAVHVLLFAILAWLATGYLRGFLRGTDLPLLRTFWRDDGELGVLGAKRPMLAVTEVATALGALDVLFLIFVVVQFRYLFGGDTLVQVTPDLTYADYARRGFFELILAVALVVPLLLAADWLFVSGSRRDTFVFRGLAGVQIGLVLAIAASALERLRLYYVNYGLTASRFYGLVLLVWMGAMLLWLAGTVLRGRRELFGFGALASGLAIVGLLFVVDPDALVARTNIARMSSADRAVRFDVAYAASLSADAVPALIDALPALTSDAQCPIAREILKRWPLYRDRPIRAWNLSAARADAAVREHEAQLKAMAGCGPA